MLFNEYLESIMTKSQICELKHALSVGRPVIINGPEQTSKTTLCNLLRKQGYKNIYEGWMMHTVTLSKPIKNMVENYIDTIE